MSCFTFEIVTLEGRPYAGKVRSLDVPGAQGRFGVLASHAPLISLCVPGRVRIVEDSGREVVFQTGTGFFEVLHDRAVMLADVAAPASTGDESPPTAQVV